MKTDRGNILGATALELVVTIFVVMIFYIALDHAVQQDIITFGQEHYIDDPGHNQTLENLKTAWMAAPWVIIGSAVIVLIMVALGRG